MCSRPAPGFALGEDRDSKRRQRGGDHVRRVDPDRRREVVVAADEHGRERQERDEEQVDEDRPRVAAAADLRILLGARLAHPAQPEHEEADDVGDERPVEVAKGGDEVAVVGRPETLGQREVEDEQCHREGEDAVGQRIEPSFWDHPRPRESPPAKIYGPPASLPDYG